jgi:RNA polymerase sigma-70 factor (ECF subfamily)
MAHPLVELCFATHREDHPSPRRGLRASSRDEVTDGVRDSDLRDSETRTNELAVLAECVRNGDERAFAALFGEMYPRLVRIAAAYIDGDAAADVVAGVFITVWAGHRTWNPADVESFLYRAVRNRALNHVRDTARELRRRTVYRGDDGSIVCPPFAGDDDPRNVAVRLAVAELNPRQRELAVLRWQEGRTPAEIAELLGTTVRAITSLQDRTLAYLRRRAPEILAELL